MCPLRSGEGPIRNVIREYISAWKVTGANVPDLKLFAAGVPEVLFRDESSLAWLL